MINIVPNDSPLDFKATRDAMDVPNEELFQSVSKAFLAIHTTISVAYCLIQAYKNEANNFNIFLSNVNTHGISKSNPHKMQEEIKDKISNFACIKDIQYTCNGSIIFHTDNLECVIEICSLNLFMGVPVKCQVIWENITNRFLLFNIPSDIPLAEVAKDLMSINNINIFEMRRFSRLNSPREVSSVLVTILGNSLEKGSWSEMVFFVCSFHAPIMLMSLGNHEEM